jgi:hypothetical protein
MAQKEYLGGQLPVNKYAFIFYFTDQPVMSYGALEHSYSSFYYMPEATIEDMNQQLRDFAAHEFFHIVTPLTVHSKEIDDFDFNSPKMSQHLWMYEGVTEYFAGNVQVKYGLITPEEYLMVIREKMITADQFKNDVPFTDISKFTLDQYHDQYYNVYQKGALIGLCLDIGHGFRAGEDSAATIRLARDRLYEVHLRDTAVRGGEIKDPAATIVGHGLVDVRGVIAALLEIKYPFQAEFEYEKKEDDRLPGLAESVGYVRGLVAALT